MKAIKILLIALFLLSPLLNCISPQEIAYANFNLAESLRIGGNSYGSLAYYNQALKLNPNQPEYWNGRARAYLNLGHIGQAISDMTTALSIMPHSEYLYGRGLLYHNAGNVDQAYRDLQAAARLGHANAQHYLMLSGIYNW